MTPKTKATNSKSTTATTKKAPKKKLSLQSRLIHKSKKRMGRVPKLKKVRSRIAASIKVSKINA
jgi:hypothetical protein